MNSETRHLDRRVVRTKKAIRAALFELAETKDISDITVSELSRKAGVNRRTFYTHYKSISDMITEIENELTQVLRGIAEDFDETNFKKSARSIFLTLNEIVSVDFDYYFRHIKMDMQGIFMTSLRKIADDLAANFTKNSNEISYERARASAAFIVAGFVAWFFEWKTDGKMPLEQAAELASSAADDLMKSLCMNSAGRQQI